MVRLTLRVNKPLAYIMSLVVTASACWMPETAFGQTRIISGGGGASTGSANSWTAAQTFTGGIIAKSTGAGTVTVFEVPAVTLTGANNVLIGTTAGDSITTGTSNVLVGVNAGTAITTQSGNTFIGTGSGDGTNGGSNTAVGNAALGGMTTAAAMTNAAFGGSAGDDISTGAQNTCLGHESCGAQAASDNGVAVGYQSGPASDIGAYIALGVIAQPASANQFKVAGSAVPMYSQHVHAVVKTLTDGVATSFARVALPSSGRQGGIVDYCVDANDATNYQTRCGSVSFAFVNEAGTEGCTAIGTPADADGTPTGTLTVSFTGATNAADTCDILANAASSLTETTLRINAHVRLFGNAATAVTAP